jgi:dihydroorotase
MAVGIDAPTLSEGVPAALVMVEPERTWVIDGKWFLSKSANTPFVGREVRGAIALTMSEGAVIFDTTGDS